MSEEHISLNQIIQFRLEKLQKLRDAGINPYPYNFKQTQQSPPNGIQSCISGFQVTGNR